MSANVAIPRPPYAIGTLQVLVVLVAVFLLGALSGYLVKPAPRVPTTGVTQQRVEAACPSGTHVVVWYTAHASACVSDSGS